LTSGAHLSAVAFRARPAYQRAVASWLPRACTAPLARLKGAVGTARRRPDSRLPTASRVPHSDSVVADRLATRVAGRRCPLLTTRVRARRCRRLHRPCAGECARAAAFLAPLVRTNPLHPRPHRSPPVTTESSCHPTPASTPRRVTRCHPLHHKSCRAAVHAPLSPRHAFPGRLPCVGEVTATRQACRATARARTLRWPRPSWAGPWAVNAALSEAELGQARLRQHCATGPSADSAQSHLIYIFIFSEYIQFLANSKKIVGFI
jgi:hypothetical protein